MEEKRLLVFTLLTIALSFLYANLDEEIGVTGFAVKEKVDVICNFVGYPVGINDAYEKPSITDNNECLIKAANVSCKGLGPTCTLRKQKINRGTYTLEAPNCKSAAVSFKVSSKIKKVSAHFSKCGEVKEKVTCNFLSGDSMDKCYYRTSSNNFGACKNNGGRCSIILTEKEISLDSTEILWTGCNSYTFTNFDGNNEEIKLHCKNKNKCIDNEYRLTGINNTGVYFAVEKCKNNIWEDYSLTTSAPPPPQVLDPSGYDKYRLSSKEVRLRIPERITDTLEEGEEKTYTLSGKSLKLEVLIIEDTSPEVVVFSINGVLTGSLDEGDKKTLGNGAVIKVIDLINNDAGESGSGDLVKFAITY